jgi:hypothetical protein
MASPNNGPKAKTLRQKRLAIVLVSSAVAALLSALPSVASGVDFSEIVPFSFLCFLLGAAAFRWWYLPVYSGDYAFTSPLAIVSTLAYIYGGPGNCLAFAYRDVIRAGPSKAWDSFLIPMASAVFGVLAFDLAYRLASKGMGEGSKYPQLLNSWRDSRSRRAMLIHSVLWVALVVLTNLYLGTKYKLWQQGSLSGSEFDNILYQSRFEFLAVAWGAVSVALATAKTFINKLTCGLLYLPLAPYLLMFLSRQYVLRFAFIVLLAFILIQGRANFSFKPVLAGGVVFLFLFILISNFRSHFDIMGSHSQSGSGFIADEILGDGDKIDLGVTLDSLVREDQDRLAGLEFVTAIEASHRGFHIAWMYGYHNWLCMARYVPRIIWRNKPGTDAEVAIDQHFGLEDTDQLSTPLSSGYADGGPLGMVLGFSILGVSLCVLQHSVWRMENGISIYLGSAVLLMNFEQYVLEYPIWWLRFLIMVVAADTVFRIVAFAFVGRKRLRNVATSPTSAARGVANRGHRSFVLERLYKEGCVDSGSLSKAP